MYRYAEILLQDYQHALNNELMSVSEQLNTYPSPINPTLTLSCNQLTDVGLGEGQVCRCLDTDIDMK